MNISLISLALFDTVDFDKPIRSQRDIRYICFIFFVIFVLCFSPWVVVAPTGQANRLLWNLIGFRDPEPQDLVVSLQTYYIVSLMQLEHQTRGGMAQSVVPTGTFVGKLMVAWLSW